MKIHQEDNFRERLLSPTPQPDWLHHIEMSFDRPSYALPGGESLENCAKRLRAGLKKIAALNPPQPAVISHGNPIAALVRGLDPNFGFTEWKTM